ncbi:amidohydrolase family protein [Micromonosporaceae bacterium Da 78-11]
MTDLLLRDVTVVDTRDGSRTAGMDVHVRGDTITAVTSTGGDADPGVTVVEAAGRFVVPGYLDMHAHPLARGVDPAAALALMLSYGITGFRQMSGNPDLLARRRAGTLGLPSASPELLATPGTLLTPANAGTAKAAVQTVRDQHASGADFIKVGLTTPDVFFAAQAEATRLGIPIVGHLPTGIDVRAASRGGMKSIEHLGPGVGVLAACSHAEPGIRDELAGQPTPKVPPFRIPFLDRVIESKIRKLVINPMAAAKPGDVAVLRHADDTFDEEKARALAAIFVADQTWQCPTLIRVRTQQLADAPEYRDDPNLRYLDPGIVTEWQESTKRFLRHSAADRATFRRNYEIQLRLVKVFDEEGVPMIVGSDVCGAAWLVPGASLHQEFDELATAGLSPLRVLQMTTLNGALFLDAQERLGSVEAGRQADLVLLDADPIEDSRHLHEIGAVVRAGRHHDRGDLAAIRERLARTRSVR